MTKCPKHTAGRPCHYSGGLVKADRVLAVLANHIGEGNGVTAEQLATECIGRRPKAIDLRYLRLAIQELRNAGIHVCAYPGSGYFIASSADELNATCEFLYDRAMSSLKQIASMKRVSMPDLRGQLRLPT